MPVRVMGGGVGGVAGTSWGVPLPVSGWTAILVGTELSCGDSPGSEPPLAPSSSVATCPPFLCLSSFTCKKGSDCRDCSDNNVTARPALSSVGLEGSSAPGAALDACLGGGTHRPSLQAQEVGNLTLPT